jgi:predicted extracellular nuclease
LWFAPALLTSLAAAQELEIFEIQGDGLVSPYEGERVTTRGNVVTAVGADVFFIQTPESRSDGNPWTSDGVLVRLEGVPPVAVGDAVDVTGTVREAYDQTEISDQPLVTLLSSGNFLPSPVLFDSELPTSLQPWPETELERFEGMSVRVEKGIVSAPSDRYGEACATSGNARLFREPGILYPGLPNLIVWDGNPEGFEIDPQGLGGGGRALAAGATIQAEGVLAYEYGAYQLWTTNLEVENESTTARPVRSRVGGEITIGTQNLWRLGDTAGDVPRATRLEKLSRQIRIVLGAPDVLAVQEVVDLETLQDLADRIQADDARFRYSPYLEEGNDFSGIDVGFLVKEGVEVISVDQVGADERFSWDGTYLFDRPPLVLVVRTSGIEGLADMTVVAVHLRSLSGIDDPEDGERVRQKRHEQGQWLASWVQLRQTADPSEPIIVLGDFNAFEFSDGYVDVMGQVTGEPDDGGALLPATDEVDPALVDWVKKLPRRERYSFVYDCSAQVLDHILTNRAAGGWVRGIEFGRGNADSPAEFQSDPSSALRSSDHDGVVIYIGSRVRTVESRRISPVPGNRSAENRN